MTNNEKYKELKGYAEVKEEAAMVEALIENDGERVYDRQMRELYDPEWVNPYPQTVDLPPLHSATYDGKKEWVESFINDGKDVNAKDDFGRTPLHIAVIKNDNELIKLFLEKGGDVNAKNDEGNTPLHEVKSVEAAKELLEKGADINIQNKRGYTPFRAVINNCDFNCSVFLLNAGADKSIKDEDGRTALEALPNYQKLFDQMTDEGVLSYAARKGYTQVIPELIEKGVDVNVQNERGYTPLEEASRNGHEEFGKILLEKGAIEGYGEMIRKKELGEMRKEEVEVKQIQEGPTLYDMQLEAYDKYISGGYHTQEWEDKQIAKFEEKERAREKNFPLHYAAEYGDVEKIKELLNKGVEVDARNNEGKTPLHVAAYSDSEEIVALLIASKADVKIQDEHGHTPLHYGSSNKNAEIVEVLIKAGSDVDARSKSLETPLHRAATFSTKPIVELLLAHGADLKAQDEDGRTPLDLTKTRSNRKEVAEAIKEHIDREKLASNKDLNVNNQDLKKDTAEVLKGEEKERVNQRNEAGQTLLHGARSGDAVKELLKKGAEVNARDNLDRTPLHLAANFGRKEVAEALIKAGADIEAKDKDGRTPLHWAVDRGNKELTELLLDMGADKDVKNNNSFTPLHEATLLSGKAEIAELLIKHGADVNVQDNWGYTPLHLAIYCNKEVAKLLIDNGANVNLKDNEGNTPAHHAAKMNKIELTELLIKAGADLHITNNLGKEPLKMAAGGNREGSHMEVIGLLHDAMQEQGPDQTIKKSTGRKI